MKTEWQVNDNYVMLFLCYHQPSETGGMSSGCSTVIACGTVTTTLDELKRELWKYAQKEYRIGDFQE